MALSRRREFAADRSAGELTGQPMALARALQRLDGQAKNFLPPWMKPYVGQQPPWLLSHPPTASRVDALQLVPENPALPPLPSRTQARQTRFVAVSTLLGFFVAGKYLEIDYTQALPIWRCGSRHAIDD